MSSPFALRLFARAVDQVDRAHHLRPLAPVAPGVHVHAPADGAGHTHHHMEAGPARRGGLSRGERGRKPRTEPPHGPVRLDPVEAFADAEHQGIEPLIGQQNIGAETDGKNRHARIARGPQPVDHVLRRRGQQHGGRATDAIGRVAGERFVASHFAPHRGAEPRHEAGVARAGHAGSAARERVSSYHSCSGRTSPTRLRIAMIASQAAFAADIVVVYGTPCWSAARRIA